jgi:enoyl-CoA hydratase/carnithine racemase
MPAGFITALGCDHRIAAEGALQFSLNEVLIGIPMPAVYCEIIKHTIGPRAASELTLLGRVYDLAAVVKMGVIGKTAAPGRLLDDAVAWAALVLHEACLAGDNDGRNRRRGAVRSGLAVAWHVRSCEPTRAGAPLPRAEGPGNHLGATQLIWVGSKDGVIGRQLVDS